MNVSRLGYIFHIMIKISMISLVNWLMIFPIVQSKFNFVDIKLQFVNPNELS